MTSCFRKSIPKFESRKTEFNITIVHKFVYIDQLFVYISGTIHDVETQTLEDRQESFFLSETCKYLYLLFDTDNPINTMGERYLFSTEGHVFPIEEKFPAGIIKIIKYKTPGRGLSVHSST